MMQYGYKKNTSFITNKKKKFNQFYNILRIKYLLKTNFAIYKNSIYIFSNWKFLAIKPKFNNFLFFFLFSPLYYFKFILYNSYTNLYYNNFTSTLVLKFFYIYNFYQSYWKIFKILYHSFFLFFLKKLKFRGKGYYIFKNFRNTITFRFGYSHRIYLYFYNLKIKFLTKTSILILGFNKNDIILFSHFLKKIRPYNLFTGKGIRFNKQIIYKKIGKASTYV